MMSRNNPRWGAPRIHGELLKLGISNPKEGSNRDCADVHAHIPAVQTSKPPLAQEPVCATGGPEIHRATALVANSVQPVHCNLALALVNPRVKACVFVSPRSKRSYRPDVLTATCSSNSH
jgi:hypothetical protein